MIEINGLSFGYSKDIPVLKNISFKADRGEILNILGPNGCGKSTLIKTILGFFDIKEGMIRIDGADLNNITRKEAAKKLSYVPQHHGGVFSYSVFDVVLMGRLSHSPWYKYTTEDYGVAEAALEKVKIQKYAKRPYLHLSGGEKQLVLIARALAQRSAYFIMDEPVTGLDYGNQFRLLQVIKELSAEGLTFILTTHHPEHALFLGGRALLIKNGELTGDGESRKVITQECICTLYDIPKEMLEKFRGV